MALNDYLGRNQAERTLRMTCDEAVRKLYEYLDKELDQSSVEQLEKHLEICKGCCDHFEIEKKVIGMIQDSCVGHKAPQMLRDKIVGNLRNLE